MAQIHKRFIDEAVKDLMKKYLAKETGLKVVTYYQNFSEKFRYYIDSHSILRFVQGRDSIWVEHRKLTDKVDTQMI